MIAADEQAVSARVNRAVLRFNAGAFDLALSDMDSVIALEPNNAEHYQNRAEIFRSLDRSELCARDMQRAAALGAAS